MNILVLILKLIFFISLFGIVHSYILYPLLLNFLNLFRSESKRENAKLQKFPKVEIIFAAYNEESVISQKLQSSLSSDYPDELLSIRIGSDASTDNTDSIVRALQKDHPQIHFTRFNSRTGKSQILNELVEQSEAELLLFTDANIIFETNTVSRLVKAMESPDTGIAAGTLIYSSSTHQGISKQENRYLKFENRLKRIESNLFGAAMGAEGGCYLIRKDLFPGIPKGYFMEDFFITMHVFNEGLKVKMVEDARVLEDVSVQSSEEYKRKVRISIGNFQNLKTYGTLILKRFFPVGFIFLSHKVLRWLTPMLLISLLMSVMFLAPTHYFFALFAGTYMTIIGLGLFGILFSQNAKVGWLKYPGHFLHMNLALLEGFFIFTKGVDSNVWQPTKRNQD